MEDNMAGLAKPSLRKTDSSALDSFPVLRHCPASVPPSNFFFPSSLSELGLPGGSDGKESACTAGDLGSIPGWERSPGEGNSKPLQYSCHGQRNLEVQEVTESDRPEPPTVSLSSELTLSKFHEPRSFPKAIRIKRLVHVLQISRIFH